MWFKYFVLIAHNDSFVIETRSKVERLSLNSVVSDCRVLFYFYASTVTEREDKELVWCFKVSRLQNLRNIFNSSRYK
jgi:hypothetical protein